MVSCVKSYAQFEVVPLRRDSERVRLKLVRLGGGVRLRLCMFWVNVPACIWRNFCGSEQGPTE